MLISPDFYHKLEHFCLLADRYRRRGADNWSAGADHPAAHDPPSWETTSVGVF